MKHHKKDCFLVAYFGDQTFAWNESAVLKPFRSYFSQIDKNNSSETFNKAVDCALEEVSRRVENVNLWKIQELRKNQVEDTASTNPQV